MQLIGRHTRSAGRPGAVLAAVAALALAGLLAAAPAAAQPVVFQTKWGSNGSDPGQFSLASAIAADSVGAGSVFVGDGGNARIQRFRSDGRFITQWGRTGQNVQGTFGPSGIAYHGARVYVAESHQGQVRVYDTAGNLVEWWVLGPPGTVPAGIATDRGGGNVYVVVTYDRFGEQSARVQRYASSGGALLAEWGTIGTGDGQFRVPQGIATDSAGNVYVVDSGNARVQKFNANGRFLGKWGSHGFRGDGRFNGASNIAIDPVDNVYVVDSGNVRVQKFTSSGRFLTKWGTGGSGDGQFRNPRGIAVDDSRRIYVVDSGNDRVQVFRDHTCPRALAARARAVRLYRQARQAMAAAARSYRDARSRGDRRAAGRAASQYFRARRVATAAASRYFAAGRVLRTQC